jgi:hypothetical protein
VSRGAGQLESCWPLFPHLPHVSCHGGCSVGLPYPAGGIRARGDQSDAECGRGGRRVLRPWALHLDAIEGETHPLFCFEHPTCSCENRSAKAASVLVLGVSHATSDGRHCQLVGGFVERQLQAADVAPVDAFRLRRIAVMRDLSFAGWTFPRHRCTGDRVPQLWCRGAPGRVCSAMA